MAITNGERGHYESAAGRDPVPYLQALENFALGVGLIPEQIWDGPDTPSRNLRLGRSTDAAVPLVWAHSEYVKLHRSVADGRVFDLVEPVYDCYVRRKDQRKTIEVWKFNRQVQTVEVGTIQRVQAKSPFLHWMTNDDWARATDTPSKATAMEIDYADIAVPNGAASLQFTFLWVDEDRWEGKEYDVQVRRRAQSPVVDCQQKGKTQMLFDGQPMEDVTSRGRAMRPLVDEAVAPRLPYIVTVGSAGSAQAAMQGARH